MSALEQIRKRPALVIGVLGVALLLFIITGFGNDFLNLIGDRSTVASVDGHKIKYDQLTERSAPIREQMRQQSGDNNVDENRVMSEALSQLINDELMNRSMEKLGVKVTNEEMQTLLFGQEAIPSVVSTANRYGFDTPEEFYKAATARTPEAQQLAAIWSQMEQSLRDNLLNAKYMQQFGALTVNKLDAKSLYDANASTSHVELVKVDYNTIADDQIEISDADIKAAYDKNKELYAIPRETRFVDFMIVRPEPSMKDIETARQEVADALEGLRTLPSTDAVASNYNFEVNNITGRQESLPIQIRGQLPLLEAEGAAIVSQRPNATVLAKLLSKEVKPDTAYVSLVIVNPATAQDSLAAQLNAGLLADQIVLNGEIVVPYTTNDFKVLENEIAENADGAYFNSPYALSLVDILYSQANANNNQAVLDQFAALTEMIKDNQTNGLQPVLKVDRFNAPATIYEIAEITRAIVPSQETLSELEGKLVEYAGNHGTAQSFRDGEDKPYEVLNAFVDNSQLSFQNLPSSGAIARWVMEAKKGDVSKVFTDRESNYMVVAAVDDIYNDYLPAANPSVARELKSKALATKKGEQLLAKYKGQANSIEGYAEKMGVEPTTIDVTYGQQMIPGFIPGDANLLASVATAKEGELVGPIDTDNSVVVFRVVGVDKQGRPFNYDIDSKSFDQQQGVGTLLRNFPAILLGNKKVDYKIQRVVGNE